MESRGSESDTNSESNSSEIMRRLNLQFRLNFYLLDQYLLLAVADLGRMPVKARCLYPPLLLVPFAITPIIQCSSARILRSHDARQTSPGCGNRTELSFLRFSHTPPSGIEALRLYQRSVDFLSWKRAANAWRDSEEFGAHA